MDMEILSHAPEQKAGVPAEALHAEDVMRVFEAYKDANDERLAQIERRRGDPLLEEKVARIDAALDRMARALDELTIRGIKTTVPLHKLILKDPNFRRGRYSTNFVERLLAEGQRVRVFDNFSTGSRANLDFARGHRRLEIVRGDLTSYKAVEKAMRGVTAVFHQAAMRSVPRSATTSRRRSIRPRRCAGPVPPCRMAIRRYRTGWSRLRVTSPRRPSWHAALRRSVWWIARSGLRWWRS